MSNGLVDTTVILHYFRNTHKARRWVDSQAQLLSLTAITWMEVMEGSSNKANQNRTKAILDKFELVYLTSTDQEWAMEQLERFQFSHHITMNDCLIASVAHRLQVATLYPQPQGHDSAAGSRPGAETL